MEMSNLPQALPVGLVLLLGVEVYSWFTQQLLRAEGALGCECQPCLGCWSSWDWAQVGTSYGTGPK